jgi:antitoxin MazE
MAWKIIAVLFVANAIGYFAGEWAYNAVLALKEGDDVDIRVAGARTLDVQRGDARDAEVLARLRAFRGRLPADFKFDRLEANERGR